ncbi:hypothetical protein [Nitratireductor sp. PBL-C9]|uniref:hypothetical protein n=1 Tax=Nitratireductor sp. PBL-C9 TaxID=3435013 RepID=UPI003D7DE666
MGEEPQNIREFKEMVGTILGRLYDVHPSELPNDADAFIQEDRLTDEIVDLFDGTSNYLVRGGFLHQDEQFYLQLTPASWDVMQKPNPLRPDEAIGKTLATWTKQAASDVGKATVAQAASAALTMLYTALKAGGGG